MRLPTAIGFTVDRLRTRGLAVLVLLSTSGLFVAPSEPLVPVIKLAVTEIVPALKVVPPA